MSKEANNNYPLMELIKKRWSPRGFSEKSVEPEKILSMFEAARWAASSANSQPWFFIVGVKEDGENYDKVIQCFNPSNQEWAKYAPIVILTVAKLTYDDGSEYIHSFHDVGLATSNLIYQAMSDGLYVHPIGGIQTDKAKKIFEIPEGYKVLTGIIIGYLGDGSNLSDNNKKREAAERKRKQLSDFVFAGQWGQKLNLID